MRVSYMQAQEHEQLQVHGDHIDSLKKAHSSMAGNKARRRVVGRNSRCHGMQAKLEEKLEEHHATLSERVNNLEKADASGHHWVCAYLQTCRVLQELASTGAKVDAASLCSRLEV